MKSFPASVQRKPSEKISILTEEEGVDEGTSTENVVLSSLVKYHKREAKPYWWSYFDAMTANDGDLILDSAILVACSLIESDGKSYKYQFQTKNTNSLKAIKFIVSTHQSKKQQVPRLLHLMKNQTSSPALK